MLKAVWDRRRKSRKLKAEMLKAVWDRRRKSRKLKAESRGRGGGPSCPYWYAADQRRSMKTPRGSTSIQPTRLGRGSRHTHTYRRSSDSSAKAMSPFRSTDDWRPRAPSFRCRGGASAFQILLPPPLGEETHRETPYRQSYSSSSFVVVLEFSHVFRVRGRGRRRGRFFR
jgi:hypothetical protein